MSISRNCRLGIKKRMMDGTYKNSSAPFGYDYVDGKLKINLENAKIVKQIFDWYISGIGVNEIAERLNLLGVRKEVWRHGTICSILTNEKYIGDTLLQKRFTSDTLPFKLIRNHGEKEQYYVKETHEPIVEKTIFETAQKILREKEKPSGFEKEHSPFRKKIICGNCGSTFRRKAPKNFTGWVCRNHDESAEKCKMRQIKETEIQKAFVRLWNKLKVHGKAILVTMLKQLETLSEKENSENAQLSTLRKEIAEIKQQIHLLTTLNLQGTLDSAYFAAHSQELDRKQLSASLDDKNSERLDGLRKLVRIFEKAELITEFDEILFGQTVGKITVLSESEIRFDLIGEIGFTERIER